MPARHAVSRFIAGDHLFTEAQVNAYAPAHPGTEFSVVYTVEPRGLRLFGEADLATRDVVDAVLAGLPDDVPGTGPLVIDVSGLAFADVGTITALVRTAGRHPGTSFTGARPMMAELLTLIAGFEGVQLAIEGVRE